MPMAPRQRETGIPPVTDYDENPYFEIEYFYRGASPSTHVSPFERCTREGDYMIVEKKNEKAYKKPVLAIRIYRDNAADAINPDVDRETFVVTEGSKALTPVIRRFENDEKWLAQIDWELDSNWHSLHVAQNIYGLLDERRVGATCKFQLDIQDGKVDWSKWPKDGSIGASKEGFEPCPP